MPPNVADCIDVAVEFLARQPGAVDRALAMHQSDSGGWCTECRVTPVRWPCTTAGIALRARRVPEGPS